MAFVEFIIVLVAAAAVASFGAAAFTRSNILSIAVGWMTAELLFALYYEVLFVLQSNHGPNAVHSFSRGVSISVVFGAPFFLIAVTGFTFFARWIYHKKSQEKLG